MPVARVKKAIEEIRKGRMVIISDDEDRENEGDLAMAAEKVTPEAIKFMAKYGRGLICLLLSLPLATALLLMAYVLPSPRFWIQVLLLIFPLRRCSGQPSG